ncbi:hypothetical protein BGZ83_003247 [Gryganskiella cystojenkinii]|nr:hypothetical protein BGZ83_003247 [Gryganskiella cystojenkinii]
MFPKVVFPTSANPVLLELTREGPIFIMTMVDNENRFTTEMCKAICDALDHVQSVINDRSLEEAVLLTRGQDKFYSNGLHMEKAFSIPGFKDHTFMPMLNKLLFFGIPTVACVNGSVILEAKRFSGKDALDAHIVDDVAEGVEPTFELAKQVALKIAPKAKSGSIYAMIKENMYPEISLRLMMNTNLKKGNF